MKMLNNLIEDYKLRKVKTEYKNMDIISKSNNNKNISIYLQINKITKKKILFKRIR